MHAAVVRSFAAPPRYEEFTAPVPSGPHQELIEVIATGLHPRVRSQANGSHYTTTNELPLIPGIDGVGRRADGSPIYFILPATVYGAMADQTVIDIRRSVPLPADADPVVLAAAMNPAMSSWIALHRRVEFTAGQSVLILGAAGSAGRLAIQTAKHLGASSIVAVARGAEKLAGLAALGATGTIDLATGTDEVARALAEQAAEIDIVLDYLWGPPAESMILPLVTGRTDASRALAWIQIGAVAGANIALPSAVLRQANIRFLGSGQGSVSAAGIIATLPELSDEITRGTFTIDAVTAPLSDVEAAWTKAPGYSTERLVLLP